MVNKTLGNILHCLMANQPKYSDEVLSLANFSYDSMINHSMGRSPFAIVYTKMLNHIVDISKLLKCKTKTAKYFIFH